MTHETCTQNKSDTDTSPRPRRYAVAFLLLLAALILSVLVGAGLGAYQIAPWRVPGILWRHADDQGFRVLAFIRFPRVFLAAIVGASLAMAGASLQGMFRNPLAAPGLIGVTSGAGLGAAIWIVLLGGVTYLGPFGLPFAAFAGGATVTMLVWRVAEGQGRLATATLLLAGIAVNSLAGAAIGLLVYMADDRELRSLTFWRMGGLGSATWQMTAIAAPAALIGAGILLSTARALNALALGETEAFHLGVSVDRIKRLAVVGAALAVGAAVASAGSIGFVGLVVPHLLRVGIGADHRFLLPASALGGATLLVLADTVARTIVAPSELPVGILTSLIGGPFFLYLLLKHKREMFHA